MNLKIKTGPLIFALALTLGGCEQAANILAATGTVSTASASTDASGSATSTDSSSSDPTAAGAATGTTATDTSSAPAASDCLAADGKSVDYVKARQVIIDRVTARLSVLNAIDVSKLSSAEAARVTSSIPEVQARLDELNASQVLPDKYYRLADHLCLKRPPRNDSRRDQRFDGPQDHDC